LLKTRTLSQTIFPRRWEEFLKALTDRLSKTNPKLYNVRCLTEISLLHLFEKIRTDLILPSTFPSGIKILDLLISMGLAIQIPVEAVSKIKPSNKFFLFGIYGSQENYIDPLELLQAYHPAGVICYFSAVFHLGLTSQFAAHHHIALLMPKRTKTVIEKNDRSSNLYKTREKVNRSKIGTPAFSYQGIPFYSTKRVKRSVPGISTRILSPLVKIRMTTKEQTLLDTLQYPYHCGGPETVLEAWEKNISDIDEELLLDYIKIIQITPLIRRLGALFSLYNHRPTNKIGNFLNKSRNIFISENEFRTISLLRGIDYSRIDPYWNVTIP